MLYALLLNFLAVWVPPVLGLLLLMTERYEQNHRSGRVVTGIAYGCSAIACMLFPIANEGGFLWDLRWVPLLLALLYGGTIGGGVCFVIIVAGRFALDHGVAAYITLAAAALLVLLVRLFRPRFEQLKRGGKVLLGIGLSLSIHVILTSAVFVGSALGWDLDIMDGNDMWFYAFTIICNMAVAAVSILTIENLQEAQSVRQSWRINRENYRILAENSADMLCRISPGGRILYVSPACIRLLGYQPDELLGREVLSLFHPDEQEVVRQRYLESGSTEEVFTFRMRKKDGTYNWFETVCRFLRNQGQWRQLITVTRDVTERKMGEVELRQSEQLLTSAQEIANIGSFEWDVKQDIVMHSRQNLHIFGRESHAVSSYAAVLSALHPEDRAILSRAVSMAISTGMYEVEYRVLRPRTDEVRYVRSRARAIYDEAGCVQKIVGTNQDVTEHKRMQLQVQESEERYRRIVESSPNAILLVQGGEIVFVNQTGLKLLRSTSVLPVPQMNLRQVLGDEGARRVEEAAVEQMAQEQTAPLELQLKQLNGEVCTVEAHIISSVYRRKPARYILLADITERKRSQELLQQSEKLKMVGELAAGIAHEIRNPLTSLRGFVQLFGYEQNQKNAEYVSIMLSEIDRINDIVGELLLLAKPNRSDFAYKSLHAIIHDVVTLLKPQATLEGIRIVNRCEDQNLRIYCVENKLKQVCLNIIKNAMEAMPGGGTIQVSCSAEDGRVLIRFEDEGCGIPPEYLPKIGQVFFTTKEKGTGLGTMVSYSIVDNHKGEMRIASEVGKGTTVDVLLPLMSGQPHEEGAAV